MSEPYIGEIRIVGFNFAPVGWLPCNGQLLSIADYQTLFALVGTTYGGDGQTTFALPDLRGRVPVQQGTGSGLSSYTLGQTGGASTVTLSAAQIASHTHPLACQDAAGAANTATGNYFAKSSTNIYTAPTAVTPMGSAIGPAGGSQPHDNMQPYLAINYIVSTEGIFPSQN